MRRLATLLIAAIAAGFSFSAFAADMPVKAPPPAVVSYNWTGFYIGGAVGARRSDTDWTTTCIGGFAACPLNGLVPLRIATNNPAGFDDTGFKGGIYGGYNWQVSPIWVLGVEADWMWGDNKRSIRGIPGTLTPADLAITGNTSQVKDTWDASIRARLGWLATPNLMLFATGGVSWMHQEASANCTGPAGWCGILANLNSTQSASKTLVGWTVGGGLEYMLTANWLIRGEYRYADYRSWSALFFPGGAIDAVFADFKTRTHTGLFGVAYKFGGPVVARY